MHHLVKRLMEPQQNTQTQRLVFGWPIAAMASRTLARVILMEKYRGQALAQSVPASMVWLSFTEKKF
jgi:hypothetical protein